MTGQTIDIAGVTVHRSDNAGGYLCEWTLAAASQSCQRLVTQGISSHAGFLHVPTPSAQPYDFHQLSRVVTRGLQGMAALVPEQQQLTILVTGFGWFPRVPQEQENPTGVFATTQDLLGSAAAPADQEISWTKQSSSLLEEYRNRLRPLKRPDEHLAYEPRKLQPADDFDYLWLQSHTAATQLVGLQLPVVQEIIDETSSASIQYLIKKIQPNIVLSLGMGRSIFEVETKASLPGGKPRETQTLWRALQLTRQKI